MTPPPECHECGDTPVVYVAHDGSLPLCATCLERAALSMPDPTQFWITCNEAHHLASLMERDFLSDHPSTGRLSFDQTDDLKARLERWLSLSGDLGGEDSP